MGKHGRKDSGYLSGVGRQIAIQFVHMKPFVQFQDFLPKVVAKYNASRQTQAALVCERFRQLAPGVVGKDALQHIGPKFFKHGTLYIRVPNSIWAQRVYVHRHELMIQLNLDEGTKVKDIRTLVEPEALSS